MSTSINVVNSYVNDTGMNLLFNFFDKNNNPIFEAPLLWILISVLIAFGITINLLVLASMKNIKCNGELMSQEFFELNIVY